MHIRCTGHAHGLRMIDQTQTCRFGPVITGAYLEAVGMVCEHYAVCWVRGSD